MPAPRLLHVGGVSNRGLAEILKELRQHAKDCSLDGVGQWAVESEYHAKFDSLCHHVDMPLKGGLDSWRWSFVDPNKLLSHIVEASTLLTDLFSSAARRCPPSPQKPWSLVIGFDEFAPGNKLKVDNNRKCMNLSFSFLELGQHALCNDLAWFTAVCVRSKNGVVRRRMVKLFASVPAAAVDWATGYCYIWSSIIVERCARLAVCKFDKYFV